MIIEKIVPSGAYRVTEIVDGILAHRTYYGYTKKESKAAFMELIKSQGHEVFRFVRDNFY